MLKWKTFYFSLPNGLYYVLFELLRAFYFINQDYGSYIFSDQIACEFVNEFIMLSFLSITKYI